VSVRQVDLDHPRVYWKIRAPMLQRVSPVIAEFDSSIVRSLTPVLSGV
jgi:hypothetical protein